MPSIDDLFPPAPRVIYRVNPLLSVVCQIKFPTLLRIEAQPPVDLQEAIRDRLPLVERVSNPALQNLPQELLAAIGAQGGSTGYVFRSSDRSTSANLTSDSLTIETNSYSRWEEFWSIASGCIDSFISIYQPTFVTRAGLRYQNVIRRHAIGMEEAGWSTLLSHAVLGELRSSAWEAAAVDARRVVRCADSQGDALLLQHGFAQIEAEHEQVYLIDFDFYREQQIANDDLHSVFKRFNGRSGRAFRWAITDQLHSVLGADELHSSQP